MALHPGDDIEVELPPEPHRRATAIRANVGIHLVNVREGITVFMHWSECPEDPNERNVFVYSLGRGESVRVRLLEFDSGRNEWTASRRPDHWKKDVPLWKPGEDVREMCVTAVYPDRIYGEILPGVRAWTPVDALKGYVGSPDRAAVFVHDYLAGYVGEPDYEARLVPLDVTGYLRDLDARPQLAPWSSVGRGEGPKGELSPRLARPPISSILVVEDDSLYLSGLIALLKFEGLTVYGATSAEEAVRELRIEHDDRPHIDMALIDLNLGVDGAGLRLARTVREQSTQTKIVLMSADFEADTRLRSPEAKDLTVHGFLAKPIGAHRLLAELGAAASTLPASPSSFLSPRGQASPMLVLLDPSRLLEQRVEKFRFEFDAETAALFSIHPVSLVTDVIAGAKPIDQRHSWEFWRHQLRFSPVRDVALDTQVFREEDASASRGYAKSRWLRHAYRYRSCLGIPVRLPSEHAFCLFAFHSEQAAFSEDDETFAELFAGEIAALLEKERLLAILESDTRRASSSAALGILGHEIGNHLGAADVTATELLRRIDDGATAETIRPTLVELNHRIRQAVEVSNVLLEFAKRKGVESVSLKECVERAVWYSKPRTDEFDVELLLDLTGLKGNPMVKAERIVIEQALFNLIANAAEQISQQGKRKGCVTVRVLGASPDSAMARILVEDNGPGIHYGWWEQIFDLGFTTKSNGSGIGLHIGRRTLKRFGGEMRVKWSRLWEGTAFEVSFPISKQGG